MGNFTHSIFFKMLLLIFFSLIHKGCSAENQNSKQKLLKTHYEDQSVQVELQHALDAAEESTEAQSEKETALVRKRRSASHLAPRAGGSENLCEGVCRRTMNRCQSQCNRYPTPVIVGCRMQCASKRELKCLPACVRWAAAASGQ